MKPDHEKKILDSWETNAKTWVEAIEKQEIESRVLITNKAIIDAILSKPIKSALDLGCGEGWLVRVLSDCGIKATGVDATEHFINTGKAHNKGNFLQLSYKDVINNKLNGKFDAVIFNFSLFGNESVSDLIHKTPGLLTENGRLIIQTLHPDNFNQAKDGWLEGSWDGFNDQFTNPAPWYFRSKESWLGLLEKNKFKIIQIISPLHPHRQKPASIIFIAEAK